MQIDIKKNYRSMKPNELREYALKGLLVCGDYDMSDFIEYIFQGVVFEDEMEKIVEQEIDRAFDEGKCEGWTEGYEEGYQDARD
jgi:hypothetical protein